MLEKLIHLEEVEKTLAGLSCSGRFPHALLIEGPQGSGKRTVAKAAAAAILCRADRPGMRPCGQCVSCHKIESGNHPDLTVLDGAGGAKSLHIDAIRELRQDAYVRPHESRARVFLIADAHNMTVQSQNALLKIIEEPPEDVYFLLTAASRAMLIETILSRTMLIVMPQLSYEMRLEALRKLRPNVSEELAAVAAQFAPTIGQALTSLEDDALGKLSQDAQKLYDLMARGDEYGILTFLFPYEKQRDRFIRLMTALQTVCLFRLSGGERRLSALQTCRIADIIEDTAAAAGQNAGLPLLSAVTAGKMVRSIQGISR